MNLTRFRIAWIMVAVAIAALDFGAIRAMLGVGDLENLLVLGALPMANVLAVGLLIAQQRPKSRPFLLGFEAFGAMALALYVFLATIFPLHDSPIMSCLESLIDRLGGFFGQTPFVEITIEYPVAVAMLGGPQLAFALLGGFLSRRFKITITPR